MKLCFVSVNGPREPYLLDEPRIMAVSELKNGDKVETFSHCQLGYTGRHTNRFQQNNHILVNIPFVAIFMLWPYKEYREHYYNITSSLKEMQW
jgi:hypothetical protein